jgi:hypothetical protein
MAYRKKADDALLWALAGGASVDQAACQCQLSARTVYRRLEHEEFRRRLQELRANMVEQTAGALTAAGAESVRTLLELAQPAAPYAVRLAAAKAILEMGGKLREAVDLKERLAAQKERISAMWANNQRWAAAGGADASIPGGPP